MDLFLFPFLFACTYVALYILLSVFFGRHIPRPRIGSVYSVGYAVLAILFVFFFTNTFLPPELGNRVLHIVGGGMLGFFLYYRVMCDTAIRVKPLQFFMLGFLVVVALGAANEHMEFLLQVLKIRVFSISPIDTWLDLASNTFGALVAGIFLAQRYARVHSRAA